ncbi:ketopantoate reductase family protein [Ammoniphilus sp. CFH 90114]|uniref:ketopantoate reductase family protein n=1 Tax=Ammoniphilus sp. CFH 90114 TaxID=2493665 RepID=UPI00100DED61|nr:2-dehydropantoate 2-reductase [Ammoniphilus sp. CFH 90114]RXT14992.1 2-dehydropantoate 2-reductase [Ammoniphilus sp. CFH 90114]
MRIGILGGGAMGLHIAAQLSLVGKDPVVICRQKLQAESIRSNGLTYTKLDGSDECLKVETIDIEESIALDWVILAVKQPQVESAIHYLHKKVTQPFSLLCFQNGMGHVEILTERLPDLSTFYAVTTEGACKVGPSAVRHTGKGVTWVGQRDPSTSSSDSLEKCLSLFRGTSMEMIPEDKIMERMWKKLVINACINPLTALLGIKNGQLIESKEGIKAMTLLFEEARTVAELEGVEIDSEFMQEIVKVCRNTYENKSSMLQDIEAGRRTEIKYINGAIERMAKKHGKEAPHHALMVRIIQVLEARK